MKKALSLFLALMLCVSLAVPALAVTSETVNDGDREITFSKVIRVDTRTIKINRNREIKEQEIKIYILPDEGSSITATKTTEHPLLIFDYELIDGVYTVWNMSDATPEADSDSISVRKGQYENQAIYGHPTVLSGIEGAGNDTNKIYYSFETYFPAEPVVVRSPQNVTVDGKAVTPDIYNINGSNYFKLRDLAALLNGTSSQFEVGYNDATKTISITTGAAYTPVGGELAAGEDKSATCVESAQALEINGTVASLTAYNIGGNNYFQLRELGAALGFGVDYDAATNTAVITTK